MTIPRGKDIPEARRREQRQRAIQFYLRMVFIVIPLILIGGCYLLLPGISSGPRRPARRTQSVNNMRHIGIALQNYHTQYHTLPAGGIVRDGQGYHSWSLSILPYLDQTFLYEHINDQVPWTDAVNQQYYQQEISIFLNPMVRKQKRINGYAASHYAGNSWVFKPNEGMTFEEMTDGAGSTLLIGEVSEGLKAWGDPTNVRDPTLGVDGGATKFGEFQGGACFILADVSIRFVSKEIDPEVLRRLANPQDGKDVGDF